eukprot:c14977_g1_i1 orf=1-345(+)
MKQSSSSSIQQDVIRSLGLGVFPSFHRQGKAILLAWKGFPPPGGCAGGLSTCMMIGAVTIGALIVLKQLSYLSFFQPVSSRSRKADSSVSYLERLTVPGLQNIGNNCFLNVILQ